MFCSDFWNVLKCSWYFFLRIASESFYSFCNRQITHYVHELQCKLGFGDLYPEFDVNFKIILSLWNTLSLKFCNWFGLKLPWHVRSVLLKDAVAGFFSFNSIATLWTHQNVYARYTLQIFAYEVLNICSIKFYMQYNLKKKIVIKCIFSQWIYNQFCRFSDKCSTEWRLLYIMKYLLVLCVVFHTVTTSAVATTNNRILLSSVLVGTALAASLCKWGLLILWCL